MPEEEDTCMSYEEDAVMPEAASCQRFFYEFLYEKKILGPLLRMP
jgi:hypothetical protein